MQKLLVIGGLFVLAGLCEIGGGYLVWGWLRQDKPLLWAFLGAGILALYGVIAALHRSRPPAASTPLTASL